MESSEKPDRIALKVEFAAVLASAQGAVTVRPEKLWAKRAISAAGHCKLAVSNPVKQPRLSAISLRLEAQSYLLGGGLKFRSRKLQTNVLQADFRAGFGRSRPSPL